MNNEDVMLKQIQRNIKNLNESIIIKTTLDSIKEVSGLDGIEEYLIEGGSDKVNDDIVDLLSSIILYYGEDFGGILDYVAELIE